MTIRTKAFRVLARCGPRRRDVVDTGDRGDRRRGTLPGRPVAGPITGVCAGRRTTPPTATAVSGNIPCMPGRLGLCLGALQNTPIPGATLPGLNRKRHLAVGSEGLRQLSSVTIPRRRTLRPTAITPGAPTGTR